MNLKKVSVKMSWLFFGHYHDDRKIMGKFILLYNQIVRIQ